MVANPHHRLTRRPDPRRRGPLASEMILIAAIACLMAAVAIQSVVALVAHLTAR
ncbi:hypothetical protein J5J86_06970 [Aquabacter sp. L1I39]|uniref:hypothetical protein n=1 Tax=Aquabacter sp. L1I39 TaxID=2820278 RepID=UPI001ADA9CEF|nr:hypothetical protein [Aquabacter sp. L1I39]QTL05041.1 hypothetical protein J5J86_06970 [Aquabacter sp. L1I39]